MHNIWIKDGVRCHEIEEGRSGRSWALERSLLMLSRLCRRRASSSHVIIMNMFTSKSHDGMVDLFTSRSEL